MLFALRKSWNWHFFVVLRCIENRIIMAGLPTNQIRGAHNTRFIFIERFEIKEIKVAFQISQCMGSGIAFFCQPPRAVFQLQTLKYMLIRLAQRSIKNTTSWQVNNRSHNPAFQVIWNKHENMFPVPNIHNLFWSRFSLEISSMTHP